VTSYWEHFMGPAHTIMMGTHWYCRNWAEVTTWQTNLTHSQRLMIIKKILDEPFSTYRHHKNTHQAQEIQNYIINFKCFQVMVFWVITLWKDAVGYQRFGGPCCLHLESEVNGARGGGVHSTLKMEAAWPYHINIWCHNPEDHNLYLHRSVSLKCGI
jgi:hypothetical protein